MRKNEVFTYTALAFSIGIVLGFLISPAKNGFGNNSGNNIKNYYYNNPLGDNETKPSV
ncbi:hypothetical protein [Mesobacillus jeotgali]|uniref:YtxH domain-containing protein n=1 Tax=Mesobacillus jeotgali TaxID=129985 RepID=A0ABY9VPT7_9BACI|nr:hypothetical protein [Mesobacillus jeotgali]WNF24892.1 hypothetical protein RH061_10575 [Mesobacillus jeotgali]